MKILALEIEVEGIQPARFQPYLKAEAKCVWELYQNGTIRELYFQIDRSQVVLMLECIGVAEAQQVLDSMPLVRAGLIRFEIIPLIPYPGFARLFGE